ncbi:uncharacterized protein PHACADRAFT_197213 [Phanerochaete carnosa HHB-10118-sp]|uniref:Uncharacterized protein n=1 Tax=Phanerochaete carnosa (strain HHB-10118-sp) TaxID=650164 RepID=K5WWD9_PHACS|nr:uncharacterized protein PHACADRAFT_197213 [Phanerochaete carnosa HHB-10118-sp]EKM54782.1 hypothetical protein PHACADRAFT_197213 [Phanerochaete carnosa HHB-10118-sp]
MDVLFGCFEGRVVCADDGLGELEDDDREVTEEQRAGRREGLVFEDAIPGVQAGKRAGMNVVWVPDPNLVALGTNDNADATTSLSTVEQPDQTLKTLEDFKPEEWGLPPYDP